MLSVSSQSIFKNRLNTALMLAGFTMVSGHNTYAAGVPVNSIEQITVTAEQIQGQPVSATEGIVLTEQLENRPASRPAELLEFTPGLIATQHSGEGKANQYFLRGFNLDHGTDFSVTVEGMPVNMRSHAHGQGYLDINFLIPEMVDTLAYRKGPYFAGVGDFSAAGSADFHYRDTLQQSLIRLEMGENSYYRGLAAGSLALGSGDLTSALSYSAYNGPWELDQDLDKVNGMIKYNQGDQADGFSIIAMGYDNQWTASDQIPQRAVDSGLISSLGFIDPTVGGSTHRYSLSTDWRAVENERHWHASAYLIDYKLQLYSNFTYLLGDPLNGDQFEQFDDRMIYGASGHMHHPFRFSSGVTGEMQYGLETRTDSIDTVGLYLTSARQRLSSVREDDITETSYAGHIQADIPWSTWFRSILGVRADHYRFDVDSDLAANSGKADDTIISPKLSFVLGPWNETELFLNLGKGFHSNDARGTTITVDPIDPLSPATAVDPLVEAWGIDLGMRTLALEDLQLAASVWALELESELVYVGDGGATEASGKSERYGIEFGAVYTPREWLIIDADYAWAHSRLADEPVDNRIPNAVSNVVSLGMTLNDLGKWSGGLRWRHFGEAPLIEDNSVRSGSTSVINGQVNYQLTDAISITLAGYNLLDSNDNDITYYYESRLSGEPQAIEDIHFHPVEPRNFRLFITLDL